MQKGEVWLSDLPEGQGHEQKGFRPVVILNQVEEANIVVVFTFNL